MPSHDQSVCAVILSAGFSTRMRRFKPLLPFGEGSVLAHVVGTWRAAGVRRVLVVGGYRADEVEAESARLGASFVRNPRPEDGMFSSVCVGLAAALELFPECRWLGVHPVDIPLVRPDTITALLSAGAVARKELLMPAYGGDGGRGGHPPMLSRELAARVLSWRGDGGLRAVLVGADRLLVPVDDPYINMDMDRPADYEAALSHLTGERGQRH